MRKQKLDRLQEPAKDRAEKFVRSRGLDPDREPLLCRAMTAWYLPQEKEEESAPSEPSRKSA